jgi:flagellar biosynthetic protein FliR
MGPMLNDLLPAAFLISLRIGALMSFAPFFGGEGLSVQTKLALTVAFTAVILPVHRPVLIPNGPAEWAQAAGSELVLGLMMALAMNFVFEAARLAGQVMGFQLGYSLVNIIDPQSSVETPVLSVFTYTFAFLIFMRLDVHHFVLRGLAHSYDVVAPGRAVATMSTVSSVLHGAAGIWGAAVEIAAPVLGATLMIDILLSFLSKASPQLAVLPVGIAAKAIVGFSVLWIAVASWPRLFQHYFVLAAHFGEHLLLSLR